ncbi:MAG: hypothetical protein FWC42_10735 [Proteobacteria bacterium]|nr:hypothetical protein [Pseudomonadota bacterium]
MPKVLLQEYHGRSSPTRLAVGDVIRCPAFSVGLVFKRDPGEVLVAWRSRSYTEHYVKSGKAVEADDDSRGTAPFLVITIKLIAGESPDDMHPREHWFSRDVQCVRLSEEMEFSAESERIRFSLNDPMSVIQPDEETVELLGYAEIPIRWNMEE